MDRGTGKTRTTIEIIHSLWEEGKVQRVLIVAPRRTFGVWRDECEKWYDWEVLTLNSAARRTPAKWTKLARDPKPTQPRIAVINYEAFIEERTWKRVAEIPFDLVAFDESTKIKNSKAKRTKRIMGLVKHIPYRYILSGLPVTNSPLDLYSQMKVIEPNIWGLTTEWSFIHRFAVLGGYQHRQIIGWRDLDRMTEIINPHCFRVRKEECHDLPPIVFEQLNLELTGSQLLWYENMKQRFLIEFEASGGKLTAANVGAQRVRLHQVTGGFLPNEEKKYVEVDKNPKMAAAMAIIEELTLAGRQVVVWCAFRPEIYALERECKVKGITTSSC